MINKTFRKSKRLMRHKSNWGYYGVRLFKKLIVFGEPNPDLIDEFYEDETQKQYLEELVLLVRAKSFDHAYKVAEKMTMKYEEPYETIYGQRAMWRIVDSVDCFDIGDELESGTEVYSTYHAIDINESCNSYIDKYYVPHSGAQKGRQYLG